MPMVAPKIEPQGQHDNCYLPRKMHVTGDIDIHEMAYAEDDKLWMVNTKMSCLCTLFREQRQQGITSRPRLSPLR